MKPVLLADLVAAASVAAPGLGWDLLGDSPGATNVEGIALDSRDVAPGDMFMCVPGLVTDGHEHAAAAVASGAVAVMVERPVGLGVPELLVGSVRPAMAHVSCAFFGRPSEELEVVGVTGTNGKTTTASLVQQILNASGTPTGLIGSLSGPRTTPEAPHLQGTLRAMVDKGMRAVAMEVSSHALVQDRVTGTSFAVGVFTNLTPEHLDYHGDLESYFAAKASLFDPGRVRAAVVNVDDPYGRRLAESARVPVTTVSRSDVRVLEVGVGGTRIEWSGREIRVPLAGLFNIDNSIAAAAACRIVGASDDAIEHGLESARPVPGRFEVLAGAATGPVVIVDFAHTPDGIEKLLASVRAIASSARIAVVFGCGGDRDRAKRPLMGAAAEAGADAIYVTSDNPRSEDPDAIIAEIVAGFSDPARARVLPDRRAAIAEAARWARPGDVVVLAGKGAETTQTIGGEVLPFDDRVVANEVLAEMGGDAP